MKSALAVALLWGLGAQAEELLLSDEAERSAVAVTAWGADGRRSIVQWRGAPVEPAEGIAVFERSGTSREARLVAVGGGAPFFLRTSSRRALVQGTSAPTWELVLDGQPAVLLVSRPGDVPRAALEDAYRRAHGLPLGVMSKEAVQASLDRAARDATRACGRSPAVSVDWPAFNNSGLPVVVTALFAALAELCADSDYREAVAKVQSVRVMRASNFDLTLDRSPGGLTLMLREDVANPKVRLRARLEDLL